MVQRPTGISGTTVTGVAAAVLSLGAVGGATVEAQHPPDRGQRMVEQLSAASPHGSLGEQARVWDRFVGTWDADFDFHLDDGRVRHSRGELDFAWVLDGRAIQDLWISYPEPGGTERGIGTSIRYFDDKSKTWRVIFVNAKFGAMLTVNGGIEGDRIVLRGQDVDGSRLRWSFIDITNDSFTWHGERSRDGGSTWRLEEEHHMRRRAAGYGPAGS